MGKASTVVDLFGGKPKEKAKIEAPEWLAEDWEDFLVSRQQIKKPMTEIAQSRMLRKVQRLEAEYERETIRAMLEESMIAGWQSIYPDHYPKRGQKPAEAATAKITRQDIERNARPGETYEQCETRLKRERGMG
jgi:hypothetical protein